MEGQIRNSSISEYGPHVLTGLRMHNKRKQIFILLMSFFWTSHSYSLIILWCPRKKYINTRTTSYQMMNHSLVEDHEKSSSKTGWEVTVVSCSVMMCWWLMRVNSTHEMSTDLKEVAFWPIVLWLKWKVSDPCGVFTSLAWSFRWFLLILFSNR